MARGITDQLVKAAGTASFLANSTIGLFGAHFGAHLDNSQENGLPAACEETSLGVGSGGMGDTGIEPVTISL